METQLTVYPPKCSPLGLEFVYTNEVSASAAPAFRGSGLRIIRTSLIFVMNP
jgi:hypothetical protein